MSPRSERVRFLFRQEQGTIDAPTWRRHTGWMLLVLAAMTSVWIALRPNAYHDLKHEAFLAPMTIVTYLYLVIFAFVVLLVAVSWVMLSMKRLRDRGEPPALAGLVPLLAFLAASAHSFQPQTPEAISIWWVVGFDVALAVAAVWTVVDLGFRPARVG